MRPRQDPILRDARVLSIKARDRCSGPEDLYTSALLAPPEQQAMQLSQLSVQGYEGEEAFTVG